MNNDRYIYIGYRSREDSMKRVPGMVIYPYVRVDHARNLLEVHDNFAEWRDENALKQSFMELNKENIQNF